MKFDLPVVKCEKSAVARKGNKGGKWDIANSVWAPVECGICNKINQLAIDLGALKIKLQYKIVRFKVLEL